MSSLLDLPPELFDIIVTYLEPRWLVRLCQTSKEVCSILSRPYSSSTVHWDPFNPDIDRDHLRVKHELNKPGCLQSTIVVLSSIQQQSTSHTDRTAGDSRQRLKADDDRAADLLYKTLKDLLPRHKAVEAPVTLQFRVDTPRNYDNKALGKDDWHAVWQSASLAALQCMDVFFWRRLHVYGIDLFYDQPRCSLAGTALDVIPRALAINRRDDMPWNHLRKLCLSISSHTDVVTPQIGHRTENQPDDPTSQPFEGLCKVLEACHNLSTLKLHFYNIPAEGTPLDRGQTQLLYRMARMNDFTELRRLELKNVRTKSADLKWIGLGYVRHLSLISVTFPHSVWKDIIGSLHQKNLESLRLENLATPQWIYFPVGSELNPWGKMSRTLVRNDWFECRRKPIEFHVSQKKVGMETYAKNLHRAEYGPP